MATSKSNGTGISVTVKVNLNGIANTFANLEPKISRSLLRGALKAVGEYWTSAVKEKVPVHLGDLKESIMYKVRTRKGSKAVPNVPTGSVEVGPGYTQGTKGRSPGVYGMFVEFGLNARKYLKHPFLRPTFDSTSDKVIQVFADAMQEGLKDVVKEDDWH